jgi:hypothetical protein
MECRTITSSAHRRVINTVPQFTSAAQVADRTAEYTKMTLFTALLTSRLHFTISLAGKANSILYYKLLNIL